MYVLLTLALLTGGLQRGEHDAPAEGAPQVSVVVELSVETFDPAEPAGVLSCTVHNDSDQPIVLPAEYDGRAVVLHGNGLRMSPAVRRGDRPAAEARQPLTIAPGKKAKLFALPLAEILSGDKPTRRYHWHWMRRPESPTSPIHRWRESGYHDAAGFHVELVLGKHKVKSKPVVLKVTPSELESDTKR